jgi:hypothetical protein
MRNRNRGSSVDIAAALLCSAVGGVVWLIIFALLARPFMK